jgi:mono/diheme cytochrome c family protein
MTTVKPKSKSLKNGKDLYQAYCASCHKDNGKGVPSSFPPLSGSAVVNGPEDELLRTILYGTSPENINKNQFNGTMPSFSFLNNGEIAAIATYIRVNFDNNAAAVTNNRVQSNR